MIRTTGFQDVDFMAPCGARRHMLRGDYGRNAGRRWFSMIGAYHGHVHAADGWFYVREGVGRYRITSGLTTPSCLKSNDGYTGSMSLQTFDYIKTRW